MVQAKIESCRKCFLKKKKNDLSPPFSIIPTAKSNFKKNRSSLRVFVIILVSYESAKNRSALPRHCVTALKAAERNILYVLIENPKSFDCEMFVPYTYHASVIDSVRNCITDDINFFNFFVHPFVTKRVFITPVCVHARAAHVYIYIHIPALHRTLL